MRKNSKFKISALLLSLALISGCGAGAGAGAPQKDGEEAQGLQKITVLTDWVPTSNYTGLYIAQKKGYFAEEGLAADVFGPSDAGVENMVAAKQVDFGISYQEGVTYARTTEEKLPIVAIATIIQHNTSGFAARREVGIKSAKDFEGRRYGGWGSPMEEAVIKGLCMREGADFDSVRIYDIGETDFFSATEKDVDFTWIFYGWDGVAAELAGVDIDFIRIGEIVPELDYYTPVFITNEETVQNDPELVRKFLRATSRGYTYAAEHPEEAAKILVDVSPEIDYEQALKSQQYLASEYISDAEKWGVMKESVWTGFAGWMAENGLISGDFDAKSAFTNEFLP